MSRIDVPQSLPAIVLAALGVLFAASSASAQRPCGTGIVTAVAPVGGSCSAFTPAVGAGPDNYEVAEGGTYTMTIAGVTECSGDTITVFVQSSSSGNFCFNATGGNGTYSGQFTMPNPACNTMPVSYKCGAGAPCSNRNSFRARGPMTGCGGVHLRASNFGPGCVKTSHDTNCNGVPTGACCLGDGACVEVSEEECLAMNGTYFGDSTLCRDVGCTEPTGACCLDDGSCVEVSAAVCAAMGGSYDGDGSLCVNADCPQPPGACCLADGTCVEVTEEECTTLGGSYGGDSSLCIDADCDQPPGACCLQDGSCVQVTEEECTAMNGAFDGDSTLCANAVCPQPPGACCLADGSCVEVTEEECTALRGLYNGDSTACVDVICEPPVGACCLEDGSCIEVTEEECTALGGLYGGDFTACMNVTCEQPPGACCLDAGTCVETTEKDCLVRGGIYHGDGSLCADVDCTEDFPGCLTNYSLDFETDDMGNAMAHGTKVDTEYDGGPSFPVTVTGSVNPGGQNTAAILNSTTGPAMVDPDLLVGKGNILILQTDANLTECPPGSGVYCSHNDDEDGGTLSFAFNVAVTPFRIVLVDIDNSDPTSAVVLTDSNAKTRTFTVPANWTGDLVENGPPGHRTLDFTTLANQPGFASTVTATEQAGFDPTAVVRIDVNLGGSGAIDDLEWCQGSGAARATPPRIRPR